MEIEEFARAACDMFERSDLVVGVSNTRHAPEYCGAVYYLMKLIESPTASGVAIFFPGFPVPLKHLVHLGYRGVPGLIADDSTRHHSGVHPDLRQIDFVAFGLHRLQNSIRSAW